MARASAIFRGVIEDARKQLLLDYKKSSSFGQHGIRGDERAAALADFLRQRLSDVFEITKGEVVDSLDKRTGQLDVIIYDHLASSPISQQRENTIVPCEALYVVIEVKSI